jgi:moderate conductance mechanosensitive channel
VSFINLYDAINNYLTQFSWLDNSIRILLYYASAVVVAFILRRIAKWMMRLGYLIPRGKKPSIERHHTLQSLVSSTINLFVFVIVTLASLALFINPDTLAWVVGLFSAAFGFGARLLVSDYLGGLNFLFEDTFAVGEKIEVAGSSSIEGVVEEINLRTTLLRSPSGELHIVPNGEIRSVRNFSRGKFSIANITVKIQSSDLGSALTILESFGTEAVVLLPNLIEPWRVTSPQGMIGQYTELTLLAKARFGKAAELRPRLLALVQDKLLENDIQLVS